MAAKREIKTILSLDGEQKYKDAIKSINKEQQALNAETKAAKAAFEASGDEQAKLQVQSENLAKQIELQKRRVEEAQNALEQSKKIYGENSNETMGYRIEVAKAEESLSRLQTQLLRTNKELLQNESRMIKTGDAIESAGKKTQDAGEKMAGFGDTMTEKVTKPAAGAATAILAIGIATGKASVDADEALNKFIGSTGKSKEEAEQFRAVMLDIYGDNFGDSFEDIADAMALINQQMGDMPDEQLKKTAENAFLLRDTFDIDINEGIRGANALMLQFGVTADEAYNLMVQGAQNGLNQNQDLADQISEYAVYYADMGFSIDEMFGVMENGAKNGAFQIDYLNDLMKEFGIRTKDNSDSTKDAFKALGLDAKSLTKAFANGGEEAKAAFKQVTTALFDTKDAVKQNEIGVALFGTKWEDLGVDAVMALTETNGTIDRTKDKLGELNEIRYDDLGSMLKAIGREITVGLLPAAQEIMPILIDVIKEIMPDIQAVLPDVVGMIKDGVPVIKDVAGAVLGLIKQFQQLDPRVQSIIIQGGLAVAALGPVAKAFGNLTSGVGKATEKIGGYIKKLGEKKAAEQAADATTGALTKSTSGFTAGATNLAGTLGILGAVFGATMLAGEAMNAIQRESTKEMRGAQEAAQGLDGAIEEFKTGVDGATSSLSGLNDEAFMTGEKMTEIEDGIRDAQSNILGIAELAAEETREYTQKEKEEIQALIDTIQAYTDEKLVAYQKRAEVVQAQIAAEKEINAENAQELIKGAQEARDQTIAVAEDGYNKQIAAAEEAYGHMGELDKEAYDAAIEAARKARDEEVAAAGETYTQTIDILQKKHRDSNASIEENINAIAEHNQRIQELKDEETHVLEMAAALQAENRTAEQEALVEEYYNTENALKDHGGNVVSTLNTIRTEQETEYSSMKDAVNGLKDDNGAAWLAMIDEVIASGGTLDEETQALVDLMVDNFDDFPADMEGIGEDGGLGFVAGLKSKNVVNQINGAAKALGDAAEEAMRKALDSHSPSRRMEKVGITAPQGLVVAFGKGKPMVAKGAKEMTDAAIDEVSKISKAQEYLRMVMGTSSGARLNWGGSPYSHGALYTEALPAGGIDKSRKITQNFYGDIHASGTGERNATLQQLQFMAQL